MPVETREEIADRVAKRFTMGGDYGTALKTEILNALKDRDERAARMVEKLTEKQSFVASVWAGLGATRRELQILCTTIRNEGHK